MSTRGKRKMAAESLRKSVNAAYAKRLQERQLAKEVTKEQPMSDTLPEREDQMSVRDSRMIGEWCDDCHGYVHAPWCPAYKEPQLTELQKAVIDHDDDCARLDRNTLTTPNEHQPAARGGGDEWRVVEIGRNTYIERGSDDPFICDMQTNDSSDAERREARQLANQIVDEHRQHQALVAERESLRQTLIGISLLAHAAWIGCNKRGDQPTAATFAEIKNAAAEAVHQQRSTSA